MTAIYTSNVEQYLFQSDTNWRKYYGNVATLPIDAKTMFIRSVSNRGFQGGPGAFEIMRHQKERAEQQPVDDIQGQLGLDVVAAGTQSSGRYVVECRPAPRP